MKKAALLHYFVIPAFFLSCSASGAFADVKERIIDIGGRPVQIYSPSFLVGKTAPVLLMLHGGGGSSSQLQHTLDASTVATRGRFHVAYLNGTPTMKLSALSKGDIALGRTWNAGACCNGDEYGHVDDVAYLDQVIDTLIRDKIADPEFISILGHSNGAMMAYRYACEKGNRLAGIIPISAVPVVLRCQNMSGAYVLHIHGQYDEAVPIGGGKTGSRTVGRRMKVPFMSVEKAQAFVLAGGAGSFAAKIVPNAEHAIDTIDEELRKQTRFGLMDLILMYLNGRDLFPK